MTTFNAFILGLVQGLTEFLPVSSSGHLAIFGRLLGIEEPDVAFAVLLHLATLISVSFIYYRDIIELAREFFGMIFDLFRGKFNIRSPYRKLLILLIVATIPAAILGLLLNDWFDALMANLLLVGCMLILTCLLMFLVDRLPNGKKDEKTTTVWDALLVGIAQAFALMPGLSRSGSTITSGHMRGFNKKFAVRFSFLMSIPTILGAVLLEGYDAIKTGAFSVELMPAIVGFITAALVGIIAIKFLIKLLNQKKFYYFGIYCAVAGVVSIVLHFTPAA